MTLPIRENNISEHSMNMTGNPKILQVLPLAIIFRTEHNITDNLVSEGNAVYTQQKFKG